MCRVFESPRGRQATDDAAFATWSAEFDGDAPLDLLCGQLLDAPGATDDTTVFMVRATEPALVSPARK